MKRLLSALLLVVLSPLFGAGENVTFQDGHVSYAWIDEETFALEVFIAPAGAGVGASETWVITNLAHRFDDGVFSWQIHLSEEHESILIVPNDFLMTRTYGLAQMGIDVLGHQTGESISVRFRVSEEGPVLIRAGDLLEVHALWTQMEPLISLDVPRFVQSIASDETSTVPLAGGGGTTNEPDPPIASQPLPELSFYKQGDVIVHRFMLQKGEDALSADPAVVTYSLVRTYEGEKNLVETSMINADPSTGLFELRIETADLIPAIYDLYAWIPGQDKTLHKRIEIQESGTID